MIWTLENITFVVIMIAAAFGGLMALVGLVCEIVRMTPWYIRNCEKMTVKKAEQVVMENYICYECPECGTKMRFPEYVERYCNHCGHEITDEEKKKYEKV